ncbi:MAG TPA: class I SAM-dependent methyltransferase [Stellaceae bacterium]|nr:class I SAM-dependent methyltransferase [Stellaceae bacterium]
MSGRTHERLVADQFGPRAAAYISSSVHARGPDLQRLADTVKARETANVLDLGCGGGHVSFTVAPHVGEVVAYDLSAEMLAAVAAEAAKRGITNLLTQQGKVESLPFADGAFELVLSRFSAHHWQDWKAGLKEARRVLRAKGRAVFVDVVASERTLFDTYLQALELLRDPSHVRDYSIGEWRAALTEAGFAPGTTITHRLRLDYASWVERMQTPEVYRRAIRALQTGAPGEVAQYFAIEEDGSFLLDVMTIEATPA